MNVTEIASNVMMDDFLEWVKDPCEKEFKQYKPLGNKILIRVYYFDASKYSEEGIKLYKDMISQETVTDEMNSSLYPIAKVLAIGNGVREVYQDLKPGELVIIPDSMTGSIENQNWRDWQVIKKEKPSIEDEIPEPSKYIGKISTWRDYIFVKDKLSNSPTIEDAFTFLIPEGYILARYDKD